MSTAGQERAAVVGLGIPMALAAATMLVLSRELIFFNDELGWLASSRDYEPGTILQPHNSHLIAVPRLIYGTLARVFGPEYLPFRITAVIGLLVCVGFLFVLARRRVGGPVALAPAIVLLFFGSSWNVVLSPIGIPFLYSIGFGLGALVAMEQDDRAGDILTAILLLLSIGSHTFGAIFAVGVAVYVLLDRARWRRAWVFAAPLALYVVWWVWARRFDQGIVEASNVVEVPLFVVESFAAVATSLVGLNVDLGGAASTDFPVAFDWTLAPLIAVLALVGLALLLRRRRPGPWFWAFAAILLAFWIGLGLSEGAGRQPTTSRYLFPGAILLLLVAAEALRGLRIPNGTVAAVYAVAAIGVAGNAAHLSTARDFLVAYSAEARAQLAAVELAEDWVPGEFRPADLAPRGSRFIRVPARSHLAAVDRWGSFALSPEELAMQPEPIRRDADLVLARAEGLIARAPSEEEEIGPYCQRVRAGGDGMARFRLPRGETAVVTTSSPRETIRLRRFADQYSVSAGYVVETGAVLTIPEDDANSLWWGTVRGNVLVCEDLGRDPPASALT